MPKKEAATGVLDEHGVEQKSIADYLNEHPGSHTFVSPRNPKWDWESNSIIIGIVVGVREAKTVREGKPQLLTVIDVTVDDKPYAIICTRNLRNLAAKCRANDRICVEYTGWHQDAPGAAPSRGFKAVIQHPNGQVELV